MHLNAVNAASARPFTQRLLQLRKLLRFPHRNRFNVAAVGVAHPSAKPDFGCLALHKPSKSDTLNAAFNLVVANQAV